MIARAIASLFAAALLLPGCAYYAPVLDWDYDPRADFASLRSYAWMTPASDEVQTASGESPEYNSLVEARVRAAVDDVLTARGYWRLDDESRDADFLVTYHVLVQRRLVVHTYDHGWGYGYGWGPGYVHDTYVTEYDEGTLLIDVLLPDGPQLIWRGSARARLQTGLSPEEREEQVRTSVNGLLERFPPPPPGR